MNWNEVFHILGATITAAMGMMGLVSPTTASKVTGLSPSGKLGLSEIRATYGGLFLAMGLWALISRDQDVFITVGLAWGGAAAGRIVSVVLDRSFLPKNLGGIVFEAAIAWLLLTPRLW